MKLVALVFICFAAATILDTTQALRRIKRNPASIANATKLDNNDFVELRLADKGDELNIKDQREANAATAVNAVQQANFKEQQDDAQLLRNQQQNNNEQNTNGEQHQAMQEANSNNNNGQQQKQQQQQQQQRFIGKQQQDGRPLFLGNNALAYLLQNKANHKMNGMAGRFSIEGDRGGNTAKVVLVGGSNGDGGGGGIPFAACNARKNSNANLHGNENNENNNGNNNYNNNNNNDNNNANNNNNNNNNNFDNMNGNNYDPDRKPTSGSEQLQLENPMHQNQQLETATCAAPQQQQQQQHFKLQKQNQNRAQMLQLPNLSAAPGQSSIVLSISRTGMAKPEEINMKNSQDQNQNGQNGISKYEPMGNVLKLANMLIYKLDNFPPFRTGGQQFYLGPNANGGAPFAAGIPDNEDFDTSMDYLYSPLDNNNQHAPLVTNTGATPSSFSIPLMSPFLFQPQFGAHEPSMQPMNLIETALDKLIANGIETDDGVGVGGGAGDGEELELRCPVHHETIKRNGTAGNELKDDVLQVCSCRLFKKKKNTGGSN